MLYGFLAHAILYTKYKCDPDSLEVSRGQWVIGYSILVYTMLGVDGLVSALYATDKVQMQTR